MSAPAASVATPAGSRARTRIAAILVLIGLAAIAYYAMFAGPTTVHVPPQPQAAPVRTAPPVPGEEREGGDGGRFD